MKDVTMSAYWYVNFPEYGQPQMLQHQQFLDSAYSELIIQKMTIHLY